MECERGSIATKELQSGDKRYIAKIRLRKPNGDLKQVPEKRWEDELEAFEYLYELNQLRDQTEKAETLQEYPERAIEMLNLDVEQVNSEPNNKEMTFNEFVEGEWKNVAKGNLDDSTFSVYKAHLKYHLKPVFGETLLRNISPRQVEQYYADIYQSDENDINSVSSIRDGINKVFNLILNKAANYGRIEENPLSEIDLPSKSKNETNKRIFEYNELFDLLDRLKKESYSPIYEVAYRLGLRRGEAMGLRWDRVNFNEDSIDIRGHDACLRQNNGSGKHQFVPTKSSSERTLPMDKKTTQLLLEHRKKEQKKFERLQSDPESDTKYAMELVFTARNGNHLDGSNINRQLNRVLEEFDLGDHRYYDFRHTFATHAIEAGISLPEVSRRLGHKKIKTTADKYLHLTKTAQANSTEKLENYWDQMSDNSNAA